MGADMWNFLRSNVKSLIMVSVASMSVVCVGLLMLFLGKPGISNSEILLSNLLIFILTTVISIIVSFYFSKTSNAEKIDTIAQASVDKMVALSIELKSLRDYVDKSQKSINSDIDQKKLDLKASRTVIDHNMIAISEMLFTLYSSNEVLRGDWLGIVSPATRAKIERKYAQLNKLFDDLNFVESLSDKSDISADESEKFREKLKDIRETEKSLQLVPNVLSRTSPAVRVEQFIEKVEDDHHTGQLVIEVIRETYIATGTGKIQPNFQGIPSVWAELVTAPSGLVVGTDLSVSAGCGTVFDFAVTIKSIKLNVFLQKGRYVFNYSLKKSLNKQEEKPNI
jgi:hypothetical protein